MLKLSGYQEAMDGPPSLFLSFGRLFFIYDLKN
jgi:hypothetical protein